MESTQREPAFLRRDDVVGKEWRSDFERARNGLKDDGKRFMQMDGEKASTVVRRAAYIKRYPEVFITVCERTIRGAVLPKLRTFVG